LDLLDGAARGMSAQRTLLDIAARNVAAAQAAVPGHPYQRLVARLAAPDDDAQAEIVRVATEPGSGDALTELIAVLDAQRAYEADASIFDTGKRLVERTLDIER
jgi:flagellar basal body rod protein FlgC